MNRDIVESFADMVKEKGIDKDVLAGIIEEVFGILVKKKYGEEAHYEVVVNMDRGDIQIFLEREIVEEVEDENTQISIDEVNEKGNEDELEVGEDFVEEITLASLGRRLVLLAKQSLNQKIREIEKDVLGQQQSKLPRVDQVHGVLLEDLDAMRWLNVQQGTEKEPTDQDGIDRKPDQYPVKKRMQRSGT